MSAVAIDTPRLSSVVMHEYEPSTQYCRDVITVNEGSQLEYPIGTVLGKVTATGKYKRVEATAVDGSEVAAAIYISAKDGSFGTSTIAASTDTSVIALVRGNVIVGKDGLVFGASVNTNGELNTAYSQLAAVGILCRDQIGSFPTIAA